MERTEQLARAYGLTLKEVELEGPEAGGVITFKEALVQVLGKCLFADSSATCGAGVERAGAIVRRAVRCAYN